MEFFKPETKNSRGFALIEVIVGIGVAGAILAAFSTIAVQTKRVSRTNMRELQATMYLREAIETVKDLEQSNWAELADVGCLAPLMCRPQISGGAWTLVSGSETLDGDTLTRSLSWENVFRDQLTFPNVIVETPGILDPNTKKVTARVTWNTGYAQRTETLETYVYHLP